VVQEANRLGLVCYDMQLGKLYLPPDAGGKKARGK
jgi:hypothetical protein